MPTATAFDRDTARAALTHRTFDLVVVGGGVTGAGVALDAAARGLRTALVEGTDLGSGTSSASSKMVHGGLRYLQSHDFRLVHEALVERQRLLRNAPHLVQPLPFLIPLFGRDGTVSRSVAKAYGTALWIYDVSGGWRIGHRHQRIGAETALAHVPDLEANRLVASFRYWDAQVDDARLALTLARTAALAHGATVATRTPVVGFWRQAGQVRGVRLDDGTVVRGGVIVNAGGVWASEIDNLDPGSHHAVQLTPAKGVHVTVPASRLPCDHAAVLSSPGDHRSVFIVPWDVAGAPPPAGGADLAGRFTYIGTTDTTHEGPLDDPRATADDVAYLLAAVNRWTSAGLTPADVTGTWAGLRPLIADAHSARTADLSRRHRVTTSPDGVVTVTGGKLTTYRLMAAETVDVAVARLGRRLLGYSPTRRLPLWGASGWSDLLDPTAADALGLPPATLAHLARRYGGEARTIAALVTARPELGAPLVDGLPYLAAEAVFAVRYEMAGGLLDVLARRTRALLLDRRATAAAAPAVARLIGGELGWSAAHTEGEVQSVLDEVAATDAALSPSDDAAPSTPEEVRP